MMKKVTVSLLVLAGFASTSAMAEDAFSYAKGSAIWARTTADHLYGKITDDREPTRNFGGLSVDVSKSFGSNLYGRGGVEYTSRSSGNDSMGIYSAGLGIFTPLSTGLNLYGEAGLSGYTMERQLDTSVNNTDWDVVARTSSGGMYGEVGLRYDLGNVELSTAYRIADMTESMEDFKVGAAYKLNPNWALTADYTYRYWDLQKGSIYGLGVKYSF